MNQCYIPENNVSILEPNIWGLIIIKSYGQERVGGVLCTIYQYLVPYQL